MTLVCFPMRIDWELATGYRPAVDPYPAPLVAVQERPRAEWPKVIGDLWALGEVHGWDSTVTYAVGYLSHASYGTPGDKPKQSWAVRMKRGGRRAVAVRMGDDWESLWTWSSDQFFTRHGTLGAFMDAVSGPAMCYPSGREWDDMLVRYPKRPTRKEWEAMRA